MSSLILHISDLHISLDKELREERLNEDSYLRIPNNKEKSELFIQEFINRVKEEFPNSQIYLIVTGDITDRGAGIEFNYATKFLSKIIKDLNINKDNVLIIPGDHDVSRKDIESLEYSKENFTQIELNKEKFKNFSSFYEELLNKKFDPNKIIFDQIIFEDKIQLVGINSSYYVNLKNTEGKIDISKFLEELPQIRKKDLKIVICCHHNITSSYENKNSGQWNVDNRIGFISALDQNDIKYIFSGNEHTNACKKTTGDTITVSDAGALSSKKSDAAFKIYELVDDETDIILKNHLFGLQKTGSNDSPYYWEKRTNKFARQPEKFEILLTKPPQLDTNVTDLLAETTVKNSKETETEKEIEISSPEVNIYYNPEFTDVLYDKVKSLNLFHSGHFHWSETSRAHNWIDTSKLIEKKKDLDFTKNAVIDVIEKKKLNDQIDLIIGLGYEGNIISTKAAIKFDKPYAFLPYSYRYDEHHSYENELNFTNKSNDFKNVLIVTDVVNDGRTIRKLIKKRQETFFKNVEKIFIVSLFYTGHSKLNNDILNFNFVKNIQGYKTQSDEEINNLEFYAVKSIMVEKCPYGENFREECLIVKDNLGCVNLFYDESKYIE